MRLSVLWSISALLANCAIFNPRFSASSRTLNLSMLTTSLYLCQFYHMQPLDGKTFIDYHLITSLRRQSLNEWLREGSMQSCLKSDLKLSHRSGCCSCCSVNA